MLGEFVFPMKGVPEMAGGAGPGFVHAGGFSFAALPCCGSAKRRPFAAAPRSGSAMARRFARMPQSSTATPHQFAAAPHSGTAMPQRFAAPDTTINAQGQIEFLFTVPGNAAFFRVQAQ